MNCSIITKAMDGMALGPRLDIPNLQFAENAIGENIYV
jgi:hypothetical protein